MIKRAGAPINNVNNVNAKRKLVTMNARTNNVKIASETLDIIRDEQYTSVNGNVINISSSVQDAILGSVLYDADLPVRTYKVEQPIIEVTNETTTQAAVRLLGEGKTNIAALNFASARNVGGGFLGGAIAQEEDLCRRSALYACIQNKPKYYNDNIICENTLYTDNIIYSPNVPFFRDEHLLLMDNPYLLSIITAPAPNMCTTDKLDDKDIEDTITRRIDKILDIASKHGHSNLILGAWGCGSFGNDPTMVATAFKCCLESFPAFKYVCFAVYDNRENTPIFNAFKNVL